MDEIVLNWPQITYLVLLGLKIFIIAVNDGKPLKGDYSFPISFLMSCFLLFILYKGGFFNG